MWATRCSMPYPHRSEARTLAKNNEHRTTKEKYMGKLEGKSALITGGNSGIGLATAKQFVHEGAYVFITGRRKPELAAAVKEIGSNVTAVQGDMSNLGDLDRLFAHIQRETGRLDSVFANAGVATYAPLGSITEELYDAIFDINVKGVLFTVQKALPLLPDGASIILNGFVANFTREVVKRQLPRSVEGIRRPGSRIVRPQCGSRFPLRLPVVVS